jgi:ATP-binding cassette, subfamily B, bacterial PglK
LAGPTDLKQKARETWRTRRLSEPPLEHEMKNTLLLKTYSKLLDLMNQRERRTFVLLLVLIVLMGFAQMIGVAAILPFLAVLADPGVVETNAWLAWAYEAMGFTETRSFLVFLGAGLFLVLVLSLAFKTVTQYAVYRFATMRGFTISCRLLRGYLAQPYPWFLNRHSAELHNSVLISTMVVMSQSMMPAMKLLSHAAVVLAIVAFLVFIDPVAAGVLAVLLGGSYAVIYLAIRSRLTRLGEERLHANEQRFHVGGDAIGGIKDVKVLGLEESFVRRFIRPAWRVAECDAANSVLADVPRNLLEMVAFGGMMMFVLFMLSTGDTLADLIPILGLYALAAVRMFPALQISYASFTQMRFGLPTLERLHNDIVANPDLPVQPAGASPRPVLHLTEKLELDDIHYAYPQAERTAVRGLSMAIDAKTTVGIVGGTGAGKTTVIDIILGLLEPQAGALKVDGLSITGENRRAWQNAIGYVPQQIFLSDDTVRGNIAFGRAPEEIDDQAVERAARLAALHNFVLEELPQGYKTKIGERGVRLSGGQRQRIGIARALYGDPDILILDEATSALDTITEKGVMEAVGNLARAKTIIMIAHRLSTVRNCDVIYLLERGRVVASGSYDELVRENDTFRAMTATA